MNRTEQTVVIVGAGPAGMMLAYQLVSSGVKVRVLERHPDFRREFRGELMQRSVIEQLEKAGIFDRLLERGLALPNVERRMFLGHGRKVRLPGPVEIGAIVSQPGILELLNELCSAHPHYRLEPGVAVLEAIRDDGKVVALKVRRDGSETQVEGDLFIVCNGRNSALRKSCGLETETFESTADALWLRFDFSDAPGALPSSVDVHMFGRGVVTVLQPSSGKRLHIAYSAPGDLNRLKKDLPELRRRLLPTLSGEVRRLVDAKLDEKTESQVLKIVVDRVKSWCGPGILFLGDAAHTMSPSGGQGLNVAIRDTFTAANLLVPALQGGEPANVALLERIQAERQPEIEALQARQTRAGQMVMRPLGILHIMVTILGLAMKLMSKKLSAGHGIAPPQPNYLKPIDGQDLGSERKRRVAG
jgi:2-polyprenyl-6-methoxyphenol hydroxylase-like FAD-dependent oxidoreductase